MICNEELTNDQVCIIDDFLPSFLINQIENDFFTKSSTKQSWIVNSSTVYDDDNPDFGSIIMTFYGEEDKIYNNVRENWHLAYGIMATIESKLGVEVDVFHRVRMNCTFPVGNVGMKSLQHIDMEPLRGDVCTALIYLNDVDGDIEVARITPKRNRAIFFDSEKMHCGEYPSKKQRYVINSIFSLKYDKNFGKVL